jgi:uncharacterized membrane protein YvlD (DUF360 family)
MQSDIQAKGKSKDWYLLLSHVFTYTLVLATCLFIPSMYIEIQRNTFMFPWWLWVNGSFHFVIDAITSRITGKLWAQGEVHNFFVIIGLDQLAHTLCLISTWIWLMSSL